VKAYPDSIREDLEGTWKRRKERKAAEILETTPAPLSQHRFGRGTVGFPQGIQELPSSVGHLGLFPADSKRRKQ
jgi:hypothetical protein